MEKNNLMIMSKPYAHLQTINKTFAKFQKDLNKIVGEVALTKYPLNTSMTKFTSCKKKNLMSKPHAHLQLMYKTSAKFQKDLTQTVG